MKASPGLRRLLSGVAVAAALLLLPAPALADCQPSLPLEQVVNDAPYVFVGRVSAVDAGGFSADVEVIEVWRGDVADRMVVDGGLDPGSPAEDDRRFEAGLTYIFLPSLIDGHLVDSICSATTTWDEATMAGLRPPEVTAPEPLPTAAPASGLAGALGDYVGPVLVVSIIGGLLLVTVLIARRRET
jgi:hypothetical protein